MAKISISNRNRSLKIPSLKLRRDLERLARVLGVRGDLHLQLVNDRVIQMYNRRYLGHDYPTDVIAFPYEGRGPEGLGPGGRGPGGRGETFGDLLVSTQTARSQALEQGHSLLREVRILMIHGLLHLLGYRDKKKVERARMWRKTHQLLKVLEEGR